MGKVKGKKGFTLIEVITVCVIIAIAASIAVPNFSNIVKRNQMRALVQSAQWAEDATMALTGLQYARTASGNPLIVPAASPPGPADPGNPFWVDENAGGNQYVYVIDDKPYTFDGKNVFRTAPANIANTGDKRKSAGLTELYKRTMNDLPAPVWRGTGTFEDLTTCSVYFYQKDPVSGNDSNIQGGGTSLSAANGKFVKYFFAYSEYYKTEGNRQLAIFHGIRFHGTGDQPGTIVDILSTGYADTGWHIYEKTASGYEYYGSL